MPLTYHAYDHTSPNAIEALRTYLNAAIKAERTGAPYPSPEDLLVGLPQGSLKAASITPDGLVAFIIMDREGQVRSERFIEPEGFAVLRVVTLFSGGAYIDTNQKGGDEYHYLEMFNGKDTKGKSLGITLQRLLADAQQGETVKMTEDHHFLTSTSLTIAKGRDNATRGRREAYAAALGEYDKRADRWGLAETLSRNSYYAMLRAAFRLYDLKHGYNYLRAIGP